jgi:hypothetical protein
VHASPVPGASIERLGPRRRSAGVAALARASMFGIRTTEPRLRY